MEHPPIDNLSHDTPTYNFLRELYGDDAPGSLTIWIASTQYTQWFRAHNLEAAAAYALKQARDVDVYFGVGLRGERLHKGRGEAKDVIALPGLYADIDIKHPVHKATNLPESIDQARLILDKIPLAASVIILSGHGLQAWWLLRELWIFNTAEERQAAAQLNQRLQATLRSGAQLHGWHLDGTADLARVLRLPGTYNRKDPSNPVPVTILEAHSERRYNPRDFEPYLIKLDVDPIRESTNGTPLPDDVPLIHVATLKLQRWLKYLIRTAEHPDDPDRYSDRSTPEWAALQGMIEAGYDDLSIAGVMLNPKHVISEKPREKGRRWLEQEITRARAKAQAYRASTPGTDGQAPHAEPLNKVVGSGAISNDQQPNDSTKDTRRTQALADVVTVFRKWLHLPRLGALYVELGTYAANHMDGDPVWLLLIGGSGWGKTELLISMTQLPSIHVASTLTEASLLSGTRSKERDKNAKGGLLRSIGPFGVLICKDFTSILSMNRESSTVMLAALREIYDGSWTRHVGVDGGRTLTWDGKLALLAGCTGTIDRYHAVIGAMGERFLFYRLDAVDPQEQASRALQFVGQEKQMRQELASAVKQLFNGLSLPKTPSALSANDQESLIALATLATRCRTPVERDLKQEIELIPDAEAPARLTLSLMRLYAGMIAIGVEEQEAKALLIKVGFDCMPALRRKIFALLISDGEKFETQEVADALGYPTQTTRRTLEDLAGHGIITRHSGESKSHRWNISDKAYKLYQKAISVFPEGGLFDQGETV